MLVTAMAAKKKNQTANTSPRIANRKARYDYHILEKLEVGIMLVGCEVKSIRNSQVSLAEGFVRVEPATMELFLYNVDIAPYAHAAATTAPDRQRPRKLLAHKRQVANLLGMTTTKGTTIVPLAIYFVRGKAKLEIGVVQGKKTHDKRQTIKDRHAKREIQRGMTRKVV